MGPPAVGGPVRLTEWVGETAPSVPPPPGELEGAPWRPGVTRGGNSSILTVTQVTRRISRALEERIGTVWVQGEVGNLRRQASGHSYFTLKDAGAQLACVLFRGSQHGGMPRLEDGQMVQAFGEIGVYEPRGQYQLIVKDLVESGRGELQLRFEALKRRLAAEGLFDADRRRPLPKFQLCLGLVTSPSGAALRDMLQILARRAPWIHVLIFPVRVQGAGAELEIAAGVDLANGVSGRGTIPAIDAVVVARGGGSIEDLWCFNEEIVARAIVRSGIPVVSAVGHEIDFTIADFAADVRAPTPSAAAELLAPDRGEWSRRLGALHRTLVQQMQRRLGHARALLDLHRRGGLSREPRRLLMRDSQRVDILAADLASGGERRLAVEREKVAHLSWRLDQLRPERRLERQRHRTVQLSARLAQLMERRMAAVDECQRRLAAVVKTLGPAAVLQRGFSFTTGPQGRAIGSAAEVGPGDRLRTHFADGVVDSEVL